MKYDTHRCAHCHCVRQEQEMMQQQGEWFCSIICCIAYQKGTTYHKETRNAQVVRFPVRRTGRDDDGHC